METKFLVKRFMEYRFVARDRRAPAPAPASDGPRLSHTLITSRRYRVRMCPRDIGINFNERSVRAGSTCPALSRRRTENTGQEWPEYGICLSYFLITYVIYYMFIVCAWLLDTYKYNNKSIIIILTRRARIF